MNYRNLLQKITHLTEKVKYWQTIKKLWYIQYMLLYVVLMIQPRILASKACREKYNLQNLSSKKLYWLVVKLRGVWTAILYKAAPATPPVKMKWKLALPCLALPCLDLPCLDLLAGWLADWMGIKCTRYHSQWMVLKILQVYIKSCRWFPWSKFDKKHHLFRTNLLCLKKRAGIFNTKSF